MSIIYIANAGCGKTTRMVKMSLKKSGKLLVLTLSKNDFKEIIHKYEKYNGNILENITIDYYDNINKYNLEEFNSIFIDEFQDVNNISFLENYIGNIDFNIFLDPRQRTTKTPIIFKDKKYDIFSFIEFLINKYNFKKEVLNVCHRMNQELCDLVGKIYNEKIISDQSNHNAHQGVFFVDNVKEYIKEYNPYVLKPSIDAYNNTKGMTFDHILIYKIKDLELFLDGQDYNNKATIYIALTRAKYSIGFVGGEYEKDLSNN